MGQRGQDRSPLLISSSSRDNEAKSTPLLPFPLVSGITRRRVSAPFLHFSGRKVRFILRFILRKLPVKGRIPHVLEINVEEQSGGDYSQKGVNSHFILRKVGILRVFSPPLLMFLMLKPCRNSRIQSCSEGM